MRPTFSLFRRAILLFSLVAAQASWLAAQATTASLEGVVAAEGGGALGGARIDVRSRETGAARQALTDPSGAYRVLGLAPGMYDVTARAVGYRPEQRTGVELLVDQHARLDFVLGASGGAVELQPTRVTASPALEVERTDVSTTIVEKEMEGLPLNGRNALATAQIAPGVRGGAVPQSGGISGLRFSNLYVDGADWKGFGQGQLVGHPEAGSLLPQEAIREYRVSLNPYDAEYTRGGSLILSAVTYQGSNDLHGSLFFYGQSRDLVARGTFDPVKPAYQRGQVGGNMRGPLLRDRLFFSASYEGQLTDNYITVVPGRPAYAPGIFDSLAGSFPSPTRNHSGMLRLTALRGAHTLDAIVIGRQLSSTSNFGILASGVMQSHDAAIVSNYRVWNGQLRDHYAAGGFVNELSLQLLDERDSDVPLVPGVVIQYPDLQVRGRTSFPQITSTLRCTAAEKLSYALRGFGGDHVLKAGLELGQLRGTGFLPTSKDGFFKFPDDTSAMPSQGQIGVGFLHPTGTEDARATLGGLVAGAYVQDHWRPSFARAVDLTAGVRYDVETGALDQGYAAPWTSDTTLLRIATARYLDPRHRANDLNNFAPRLAATWDVGGAGRTSLRAGYGRMYEVIPFQAAFLERIAYGWRVYQFANPGTTDPADLRARVANNNGTPIPPALQLVPDRMRTPSNRQWSVGAGQRIGAHAVLQLDYLDQHMSQLPVTVTFNAIYNKKRPLTNRYGNITLWGDFGDALYRALLTSLTYEKGPTRWTAAYTLAFARSELSAATSDYGDSSLYSMQPSGADQRHRFVLSGVSRAPFGIQLGAIATVASPSPFALIAGADSNHDGLADDFPNGLRTSRRAGWSHWYRSLDLRLGKAFGGARRIIATADVFNVLNTANHAQYVGNATAPNYRQPFGDYDRRQAQLGMRYEF